MLLILLEKDVIIGDPREDKIEKISGHEIVLETIEDGWEHIKIASSFLSLGGKWKLPLENKNGMELLLPRASNNKKGQGWFLKSA